jgi:hypothetical protein
MPFWIVNGCFHSGTKLASLTRFEVSCQSSVPKPRTHSSCFWPRRCKAYARTKRRLWSGNILDVPASTF